MTFRQDQSGLIWDFDLGSDLGGVTVDEELDAGDEAGIVGGDWERQTCPPDQSIQERFSVLTLWEPALGAGNLSWMSDLP